LWKGKHLIFYFRPYVVFHWVNSGYLVITSEAGGMFVFTARFQDFIETLMNVVEYGTVEGSRFMPYFNTYWNLK